MRKKTLNLFWPRRLTQARLETSLQFLSNLLHAYHKKKVIVLIDEYDTPIHAAHLDGYYKKMTAFLRSLLSGVLKDNNKLERGVLTGILRTSKEGIFSGLNNLRVCTLLDEEFSDKFGFTQSEVDIFLFEYGLETQSQSIREWYNGYLFGKTAIYNPWSLLQCVAKKGNLQPYWVNTSDNKLVKKIISHADGGLKQELESLLNNEPLQKEINEAFALPDLDAHSNVVWSFSLPGM